MAAQHHRPVEDTNPLLAQLRDMLTYGKVKESWSPRQNVPKAWFSHFYMVRSRLWVWARAALSTSRYARSTATRGCTRHAKCRYL
jgi:hypothetical protein